MNRVAIPCRKLAMIVALFSASPALADPATLDRSIRAVAKEIAAGLRDPDTQAKIANAQNAILAVPDIGSIDGRSTLLGRYVAEELVTGLFNERIGVVERTLLDRAMSELKLGSTDLVSAANQQQFGRFVGAHAVVVGNLTQIGEAVELNLRVVFVEHGLVMTGARITLPDDDWVREAFARDVAARSSAGSNWGQSQ